MQTNYLVESLCIKASHRALYHLWFQNKSELYSFKWYNLYTQCCCRTLFKWLLIRIILPCCWSLPLCDSEKKCPYGYPLMTGNNMEWRCDQFGEGCPGGWTCKFHPADANYCCPGEDAVTVTNRDPHHHHCIGYSISQIWQLLLAHGLVSRSIS